MTKKEDLELEERLLKKKELEERIQQDQFELAKIREAEFKTKKQKSINPNFDTLKFVERDGRLISSEVFSKQAIYEYLNEKEGTITLFNGIQALGVFGTNTEKKEAFGMKKLGTVYRVPEQFTLRFKHLEI